MFTRPGSGIQADKVPVGVVGYWLLGVGCWLLVIGYWEKPAVLSKHRAVFKAAILLIVVKAAAEGTGNHRCIDIRIETAIAELVE